jgi:hypothetical protein
MSITCDDGKEISPGPWVADLLAHSQNEYNFEYKGMKCSVIKSPLLTWVGRATVPRDHEFYHKGYIEIIDKIDVHGKLSYSNGHGTFGFDTMHMNMGDYVPGMQCLQTSYDFVNGNRYWTFDEVVTQTETMVEQFLEYYPRDYFDFKIKN